MSRPPKLSDMIVRLLKEHGRDIQDEPGLRQKLDALEDELKDAIAAGLAGDPEEEERRG